MDGSNSTNAIRKGLYISVRYFQPNMDIHVFEQLQHEELLNSDALAKIKSHEQNRLISVHWDLRTLLYFSVLLLGTGIGIIIYKNIDTIGHTTLVILVGILAAVCLFYCFRICAPFSYGQVASPNVWFDYILMLGCLLMLAFVGYLQYQYHVFGMRWGLATFIPMLFLFAFAYYFDHKGVLGLAIANLGAWMGIAVAPLSLIRLHEFKDENIIINGVILGVLLHLFSWLSVRLNIKAHFAGIYKNFGVQVLCISLICGMGRFEQAYFFWFIALMCVVVFHVRNAIAKYSFYFLVMSVIYGYVGVSYVAVQVLSKIGNGKDAAIYAIILYFIGSAITLVLLLMRYNKLLKEHDRI